MNITVKTVRGLTKSLVNQMRWADLEHLKDGIALGFLINVRKDTRKVYLIELNGEYRVSPSGYSIKAACRLIRDGGKRYREFESPAKLEEFWEAYRAMAARAAEAGQIYV